jgi:hypothetical protein
LDFKLLVDCVKTGEQLVLHLVAPTKQEKAAWVTDIAQVTPLFPHTCVETTVLF